MKSPWSSRSIDRVLRMRQIPTSTIYIFGWTSNLASVIGVLYEVLVVSLPVHPSQGISAYAGFPLGFVLISYFFT